MFLKKLWKQIEKPLLVILGNFILIVITLFLIFILHFLVKSIFQNSSDSSTVVNALMLVSNIGLVLLFFIKTIKDLIKQYRSKT